MNEVSGMRYPALTDRLISRGTPAADAAIVIRAASSRSPYLRLGNILAILAVTRDVEMLLPFLIVSATMRLISSSTRSSTMFGMVLPISFSSPYVRLGKPPLGLATFLFQKRQIVRFVCNRAQEFHGEFSTTIIRSKWLEEHRA